MPSVTAERRIVKTVETVIDGLLRYNDEKMGRQKHKRLAVSLRDKRKIVGGVVGEVWATVLFVQAFWIEENFRGKGYGRKLLERIEKEARRTGATRSYVDTMSFNSPAFYIACGYKEFGSIKGYPKRVTRHWFTKKL